MAWPKLRNRKSPGPLVTDSSHGGARTSAGNAQNPQDAREQWKLRAGGSGAPEPGPDPGSGVGTDSPGGPPAWPGEAETVETPAEASFWDWGNADDSAEPSDPGVAEEPQVSVAASSVTAPVGSAGPAGSAGSAGAAPTWRPVITPVAAAGGEPGKEGIGQRLGNLAHLSANPRMRTWQWRAIIAIVIAAAFTILVSWRLGLTLAVLAVIADTIYRARRASGQPGGRMTSAQRKTRRQLARLDRAGYRAIHRGLIPDSEEQIDHLVVGPAGVYAIDSEAWDKRMPVRTRNARQLWHGPTSKKERLEHARWESERAAELLSRRLGRQVTVRPAMAVYGPRIPWDVATIRDVDVFSGPRLRKYLRRRARSESVQVLAADQIDKIYAAAREAFPEPEAR
jgi:hypothetical protein